MTSPSRCGWRRDPRLIAELASPIFGRRVRDADGSASFPGSARSISGRPTWARGILGAVLKTTTLGFEVVAVGYLKNTALSHRHSHSKNFFDKVIVWRAKWLREANRGLRGASGDSGHIFKGNWMSIYIFSRLGGLLAADRVGI